MARKSRRNAGDKTRQLMEFAEVERLAARGIRLFPCVGRAKTPLIKNWQTLATVDIAVLRSWATQFPDCNWGAACGPNSGIWILDVDGDVGRRSLAKLERGYGPLGPVPRVCTGREDGGTHLWFHDSGKREIRSSVGRVGPGLDVRGDGGYVVIPPSVHPTGRRYRWMRKPHQVADAPEWLERLASEKIDQPPRAQPIAMEHFDILPQGHRNDGLTREGGYLRRNGASHVALEERLLGENLRRCQPPLPVEEVRRIAVSVARYAVGGPDPLQRAWGAVEPKHGMSNRDLFRQLCFQLHIARREHPIVVPLVRIAELMGVHFTTVQGLRRDAVKDGVLLPTAEQYVAHRRAGEYWFRGLVPLIWDELGY